MSAESLAQALHQLADTAKKVHNRIIGKIIDKTDQDTIIGNAIIVKILGEARERAWNERYSLTYNPHEDLRYTERMAAIKNLVVEELVTLGFVTMIECSHDVYDSRQNKKPNFVKCDMSTIRCDPRIHVSW